MSGNVIPRKMREMQNHHFDSTIWNDFEFRDDDIIITTYAKAGTTWVQQIVAQLLFNGEEGMEVADMSPWMDLRVPLGGAFWDGGARTFIHKGTNGRWREVLDKDEVDKYERLAAQALAPACVRWLAAGAMAA